MSIDLSQFHQIFFEESFEGLDVMEASLMELLPENVDLETINTIFRSAHSIKGGSATFGFSQVADFTHVLETLLDEVRDAKRGISQDDIDLYLQSVDCMRELLTALQDGRVPDTTVSSALKESFTKMLAIKPVVEVSSTPELKVENDPEEEAPSESSGWAIHFVPAADLLKTGNDAVRIFRELADLGTLNASACVERVPSFTAIDPEDLYIGWDLTLISDCEKSAIDEVFEWVVDESDLTIEPLISNNVSADEAASPNSWTILFKPGEGILRTGNDPLRMFRELSDLEGVDKLDINADLSGVPVFTAIDPESCCISWALTVFGNVTRESIVEVFEWIIDECTLEITANNQVEAIAVEEPKSSATTPLVTPTEVGEHVEPVEMMRSVPAVSSNNKDAPSAPKKSASSEASSIRVGIDKVDSLINMVGELVITQSMLGQLGSDFDMSQMPRLLEGLAQLEHNTRELQESVMRIRMLPISFAFNRFPRMVRDLCRRLDKTIDLQLVGENTELDKTVMEKIGDPLVHLVRNSVDHGIEMPEERVAAGKDPVGKIVLNAFHQGGNVVIEITDDGKGMAREKIIDKAIEKNMLSERDRNQLSDAQVFDLIFQPGFSTAAAVSDVSGRGVGMDVVRRNIQDLNGTVELASTEGVGSTVTIRLPLTLAILDGQLVRIGQQTYIFPLVSIIESMQIGADKVSKVAGGCDVFQLRNEYLPIIRLYDVFNVEPDSKKIEESLLVVVESEGEKVGVLVDDLDAQQQVVIKSLEQNYQRIEGVSGATILGNGTVALILDVPGLVNIAGINHRSSNQVTSVGLGKKIVDKSLALGA